MKNQYLLLSVSLLLINLAYAEIPMQDKQQLNAAVDQFMTRHNQTAKTSLTVLQPDMEFFANQCAVPLKIEWTKNKGFIPQFKGYIPPSLQYWDLEVSCSRTIEPDNRSWSRQIPTNRIRSHSALFRTTNTVQITAAQRQDLQSIKTAADQILQHYNKSRPQQVQSLIPEARLRVPRCAVPLTAKWPQYVDTVSKYWYVEVSCTQTVAGSKVKSWRVPVPTNRVKTFVETDSGMKDMIDIAADLMASYNKKNKTNWVSLEPNAKIIVPECTVPLTASWQNHDPAYWDIAVHCARTVPNTVKTRWTVTVPTNRPKRNKPY